MQIHLNIISVVDTEMSTFSRWLWWRTTWRCHTKWYLPAQHRITGCPCVLWFRHRWGRVDCKYT